MSKFKDKLQKMVDKLETATQDLSSLEVTTLSGEISHFIDDKGKFDVNKVNSFMSGKGTLAGKVQVIAHTHMAFDQDTILFMKEKMEPEEQQLFQLHLEMLASARASRQAFLHFLREVID